MVKVGDRVRLSDRVRLNLTGEIQPPEEVFTVTEIEGDEMKLDRDGEGWWRGVIDEMEVEVAPGRWVRARAPLLAGARARAGAQERQ